MRILISGGTVVSVTDVRQMDVVIEGEKVVAVVAPGSDVLGTLAETADEVIDASAKQAVATPASARDAGLNVFGETCFQYLYLTLEDHLFAPGFERAKYVCSTPLRGRSPLRARPLPQGFARGSRWFRPPSG